MMENATQACSYCGTDRRGTEHYDVVMMYKTKDGKVHNTTTDAEKWVARLDLQEKIEQWVASFYYRGIDEGEILDAVGKLLDNGGFESL